MKSWRIYVKLGQLCLWCTVQANSVKRIVFLKQKKSDLAILKKKAIKKKSKKSKQKSKKKQTKRQ